MPFGFPVYPTFFGSAVCYSNQYNALFSTPSTAWESIDQVLGEVASDINGLALDYSELKIVVYLPDHSKTSHSNPIMPYIVNSLDKDNFAESYLESISQNSVALTDNFDTTEEWLKHYSAVDHHWNMYGCYQAYLAIADALGLDALEPKGKVLLSQDFYGSLSRTGLFWKKDMEHIEDLLFDYPQFEIYKDDVVFERSQKQAFIDGKESVIRDYDAYFGSNISEMIVYRATENQGLGNLLIVSDSFGIAMEPLLASHYYETYVVEPFSLQDKLKGKLNIRDIIDKHNIKSVVIILSTNLFAPEDLRKFLAGK
jgi:hypothetical protein